jgi:hypothetical protein
MRNNVVTALAEDICDAGIAALRFDFRGVGNSEGEYDNGIGETDDAIEALNFLVLHDNVDSSRIGIAGYSFGAARALEVCAQSRIPQAVASIACGMTTFNQLGVVEMLIPKLLICGDHDHNFPADQFKFLSKRFGDPKQVETIYGADHFFRGCEREVAELTAAFFSQSLGDSWRQFG